jgi:hypothetical protein
MRLITSIILFSVYMGNCTAQDTSWSKLYDFCPDANIMASNNITHYADDSFFFATGHTYTPGVSTFHTYLARIGYDGNLQQHKSLYFPGLYNMLVGGYGVSKIADNKYLLIGYERDIVSSRIIAVAQPFLYIFNKNLDSIKFVKLVDTVVQRNPWSATVDKQKNIVVTGYISGEQLRLNSNGTYSIDSNYVWLAKFDSNANLLWSKKYLGEKYWTCGYKIIMNHDSTAYIFTAQGVNYTINGKVNQLCLIKVDTGGNLKWQRWLPNTFTSQSDNDLIATSDGNYAFVASYSDSLTKPAAPGPTPPYLFYGKFNEQGDTLWTKRFRKTYSHVVGQKVAEAENGDLLFFFSVNMETNSVLRTNPDGKIKWYRDYRKIDTSLVYQRIDMMSYTPKKKILLSGVLESQVLLPSIFDSTGTFSWYVLTDTFGCLQPGCQAADTMWLSVKEANLSNIAINIYPNPAIDIVHVELPQNIKAEIAIKDMSGRTLYKQAHSGGTQTISTSALSPGMYIVECRAKDGRSLARQKLVLR